MHKIVLLMLILIKYSWIAIYFFHNQ